eukprot:6482465-Amphidinium_carterae.4
MSEVLATVSVASSMFGPKKVFDAIRKRIRILFNVCNTPDHHWSCSGEFWFTSYACTSRWLRLAFVMAHCLLWIAEFKPESVRLEQPPLELGYRHRCQGKLPSPAWLLERSAGLENTASAIPSTDLHPIGLIKERSHVCWDELAVVPEECHVLLSMEACHVYGNRPVDAHTAVVETVYALQDLVAFEGCWNSAGVSSKFTNRHRLFVPTDQSLGRVCVATMGGATTTVGALCNEIGQNISQLHGLLLPFPIGSLIMQRKWSHLVLLGRWYTPKRVGRAREYETILGDWPSQTWIKEKRRAVKKMLRTVATLQRPVNTVEMRVLSSNLKRWGSMILTGI